MKLFCVLMAEHYYRLDNFDGKVNIKAPKVC